MTSTDPGLALEGRIASGGAVVAVIGLGYVGLPLVRTFHDASGGVARVIGFDIDERKVADLRAARPYIRHLGQGLFDRLASSPRFEATSDPAALAPADAFIVCVPTPLDDRHEPDLSAVVGTGETIGRVLRPGVLVVLESTSYPGTTRDEFLGAIRRGLGDRAALECGRDYFVAFSPEREDPGRATDTTETIPKLVGGLNARSTDLAAALYRRAVRTVIPVSRAEVAEASKLLENVFRAVNIALANEMKLVLDAMGIDVWEVIRAASTKPFGFMPFYPGPGLGGHCIPIDPYYLAWKAARAGRPTRFIELAGAVNTQMPRHVVDVLGGALARRGRDLRGARVLVLGMSYKPDIDDVRESPSAAIIELLRERGAIAEYTDPHVPRTVAGRRHDLRLACVPLTPESVASYDAVLLATNHRAFDYAMIARHARLIIDTRDAFRAHERELGDRLVRA